MSILSNLFFESRKSINMNAPILVFDDSFYDGVSFKNYLTLEGYGKDLCRIVDALFEGELRVNGLQPVFADKPILVDDRLYNLYIQEVGLHWGWQIGRAEKKTTNPYTDGLLAFYEFTNHEVFGEIWQELVERGISTSDFE